MYVHVVHVYIHVQKLTPVYVLPITYCILHLQEIPENGADVAHLHHVHKPFVGAGVDLRFINNPIYAMFSHKWVAQWEPLAAPDQHIGELNLVHSLQIWGYTIPFTTLKVTVHQVQ